MLNIPLTDALEASFDTLLSEKESNLALLAAAQLKDPL